MFAVGKYVTKISHNELVQLEHPQQKDIGSDSDECRQSYPSEIFGRFHRKL
jgi:hypothetical protein